MVKVKYFASFQQITNKNEEVLNFSGTLEELIVKLAEQYCFKNESYRIVLVNGKHVQPGYRLKSDDTVAFLYPLGGG